MVNKIAALVMERDKAARAKDHELVRKLNDQLTRAGDSGRTIADRAAKRIIKTGRR